ncbi:MAG: hypothetical protein QW404_03195 [Candidatus Nanoarchaeia archaeon]
MEKSEIELHVHPYFRKYGLEDVVRAMEENEINVVALEFLNGSAFESIQLLTTEMTKKGYEMQVDSRAARIEKEGKKYYILRAAELTTKENFQILTIGGDSVKPNQSIYKMIEQAIKRDLIVILDHILVDNNFLAREISKEEERKVRKVCRKYSGNVALEWNGYCISWVRELLGGSDVNSKIINLSESMKRHGYNVPVLADTDLHARSKRALKMIGTSRIITEINLDSGHEIIKSLKNNIFTEKYENVYDTVPFFSHFLPYFAIPHLLGKFYHRPRG